MADLELNSIGNGDGNNYLLRDNSKIPLSGSNQISGDLIPATTYAYDLGSDSYRFRNGHITNIYSNNLVNIKNNGALNIWGGSTWNTGAMAAFFGKDESTNPNAFVIRSFTSGNSNWFDLKGTPSGTLSWSGTSIIPASDNTCDLGSSNYFFKNTYSNTMYVDTLISLDNTCGIVFGMDGSDKQLRPRGTDNNAIILGTTFARWKEIWCTQSSINSSSDERQKQQIKPIDNDLLDAWENVNPIEFKWNDAVAEKGNNARVHTGYIAQNIQQALTENGVNPNDYGLFLYDEWGEEQEEKDEQGNIVRPYRPSGNAYGLRYTEALIVECAYLRKKNKDLQEQLNALSERLEKLENR